MHLEIWLQTAFKRLPKLETASIRIPCKLMKQKRADHTYPPKVWSSSGPASLHPHQSIEKTETY